MIIHVAIAFDKNYLKPFYALITSIFENNKGNTINIHSIISGIDEIEIESIREYCQQYGCLFFTYTIDFQLTSQFVLTNKWTQAVYYRLFFPKLVPLSVDRLLYLDTDIIVVNDLNELFNIYLEDKPLGAVYDNYVKRQEEIGITEEGEYFNSGVLLIDLKLWRDQSISEKAIEYLTLFPERIKFVDQDALNAVLKNNWCKLDWKFNVIYSRLPQDASLRDLELFIKNKVIIHFTLQRPWFKLCKNRLRFLYSKYLLLSNSKDKNIFVHDVNYTFKSYLKLRLLEFYLDNKILKIIWRTFKSLI